MSDIGVSHRLITPRGTITFNDDTSASYYRLSDVSGGEFGSMRNHVEPVPQRDYSIVSDAFEGAAYPVFQVQIKTDTTANRRTMLDTLMAALHSLKRADGTWDWMPYGASVRRQRTVRLLDKPLERSSGVLKEVQFALVAGDPLAYSATLSTQDSSALGSLGMQGPPPLFWLMSSTSGGNALVTPGGTVPTFPVCLIYGPATSPMLSNNTTGEAVSFPGLTIASGSYLEVDMRAETALTAGDPTRDASYYLDPSVSRFFSLEPGVTNALQLTASGATGATKVTVQWRDAWVG